MLEKKLLIWFATGDVGASSQVMAACAADIKHQSSQPWDESDFNRCLNLVHQVPEVREQFHKIAKISDEWRKIINNWDRLEKSLINEAGLNFTTRRSAPITRQLLQDIRAQR